MVFGLRVATGKMLVIVETIVGLREPRFSTVRWRDVFVFLNQIFVRNLNNFLIILI
jgi:hypothetical protein